MRLLQQLASEVDLSYRIQKPVCRT